MRKLFRFFNRSAIFAFIILAGIVTTRTITFSKKQIPAAPVPLIAISDSVSQRLSKAIQLPTISASNHFDSLAFRQLDTLLMQSFPLVDSFLEKRKLNDFATILKWQGKNPKLTPILLTGHMDVVPAEEASFAQWQMPPFSGAIQDGYIWGRGTLDDKSAVLGILEAAEHLLREDYVPERTIYFAFGHDEEVSGKHGAKAIAQFFQKQAIRFEYVMDEGLVMVEKALPGLNKPLAMIGIAEKGYVTLHLTAQMQDGGHSSMPPDATTIGILSKAITRLEENPFPMKLDGATKRLLEYAGPEMSLPFKAVFANLWLTKGLLKNQFASDPGSNAMIRTTTAPTIISGGVKENVLPTIATAKVNFRILPGETTESVAAFVRKTIADERITVRIDTMDSAQNPSPLADTDTFGFLVIQKSIREIFPDVIVAPSLVIGATDGRHYQLVSDQVYRFLPVQLNRSDLKSIHGINERISVESYKQLIRFYRQLILNSCK